MMRAKKQVVKEFYPQNHSPLWTGEKIGDDCNHMCRASWERQKQAGAYSTDSSFEEHHKRLRAQNGARDVAGNEDSRYSDGSGGKRPEGVALCGHELSKFYKIDWDMMDKKLHPSIVTGIKEIFTKRKYHGGDTEKEFRGDKIHALSWSEPLDGVINRFLDEHNAERLEYKIETIEYSGGVTIDEVNNEPSALVVFEVEER